MLLPDVNVLVHAFIRESPEHEACRDWLNNLVNGEEPFGLSQHVLSGFIRIVTHPQIYKPPIPVEAALDFADALLAQPRCVVVAPGPRHWEIFTGLCRSVQVRWSLVPDAYFAALAIESGDEWVTMDRGFARFVGLRRRRPF